jgi:rRNA-processing protein FCF1
MFMVPNQFGVDIYEYLKDYDLFTVSSCIQELKVLAKRKGKDSKAAKIALKLMKEKGVKIIKSKRDADKAILNNAVKDGFYVGTNDAELIKALKKHHIKIIRLRQKKFLTEE